MKAQKDTKKMKRDALMSFLEVSATQNSNISASPEKPQATEPSQQDCDEVYLQENNNCTVCAQSIEVGKVKKCIFCGMAACNDHLRKRRKKKGKFERICDNCEDRAIYDIYMKLQAKAEQSLSVEEEITTLKHENFFKEVSERRQKRNEIGFRTMKVRQKCDERNGVINEQEKKILKLESKVQAFDLSVRQLQAFVVRAQSSFKQNYEQDWTILSEQNGRLAKQLAKIQKKCLQVRSAMEKKQKQIENAFLNWQQRQFKKKLDNQEKEAALKKKQSCSIY